MNSVILTGNLTKDPELRYSTGENQTAICKFRIAVNDGFGDSKRTSFIPITVFGKPAENCDKFLQKGSKACIKGRIQTDSYEKDGRTVYTTDVIADTYDGVEFLGNTTNGSQMSEHPREPEQPKEPEQQMGFTALDEPDSEIPF